MKRTIIFTTALAAATGLFAMGAAQASGKSDKGESRATQVGSPLYISDSDSAHRVRNEYREHKEYRERNEYQERNEYRDHSDDDNRYDD